MLNSNYITVVLARLRAFAKGENIEELTDFRNQFNDISSRARVSIENNHAESFIDVCYQLWSFLSTAPSPFTLPPKYTSDTLQPLLHFIFRSIFALERGPLSPGGNIVLNGVKGVGKTTILFVAGVIAATLTESIVPVYWNYEEVIDDLITVNTNRIAHAACNVCEQHECYFSVDKSFSTMVLDTPHVKRYPEKKLLFLLDEFTNLYNSNHLQAGISVIAEYRRIARSGNVFIVLATSKTNVGKFIFPKNDDLMMASYPNLNCGLFSICEVHPIRSTNEFQNYWRIAFGEVLDDETAKRYYSQTGGVGRFIHQLHDRMEIVSPVQMAYFHSRPVLFHLACLLLEGPVSTTAAQQMADSPYDLDTWIDDLVLHNDGWCVDFLFGKVKESFSNYLQQETELRQAHIFYCRRFGFVLGGSTVHNSEEFLCRYIPALFTLKPDSLVVVVNGSNFLVKKKMDQTNITVPNKESEEVDSFLQNFSRHLIAWRVGTSETGLDRIWWDYKIESRTLVLYGLQLKTGNDKGTITCGNLSFQRNRMKISNCDDRCIAGILCKAEIGLALISNAISSQFGCTVVFDTVYICTNMQAQKGFSQFFEREMVSREKRFHILPSLVQQYNICDSFLCELYDGISWIEDIMPPKLNRYISKPC